MKRYLITLNIVTNGKKINAIRDLRGATGMGLLASKELVERPFKKDIYIDSFGGQLIVNAEQLANLVILSFQEAGPNCSWGAMLPTYTIQSCVMLGDGSAVDVSSLRHIES